jgi:putative FmdB family regulatory protein
MPTYDYECVRCKKRFEIFQKMTDEPISSCPSCAGVAHRLISTGVGIIFKGSGFYENDYKKKRPSKGDKDPCPDAKPDSCKGCSLNKDKHD